VARFWLGLAIWLVGTAGWNAGTPVRAAQVRWCLRVVPSGDLVIRYGANWCDVPQRD
jgi:hypothetical protein